MQPARFKLHAVERTSNPVQRPNFRGPAQGLLKANQHKRRRRQRDVDVDCTGKRKQIQDRLNLKS